MVECLTGTENGLITTLQGGSGCSCIYGLFGKSGGVSPFPYDSLNVGLHVGDEGGRVERNRASVKEKMGATHLLSALQVHGDAIYCQHQPMNNDVEVEGYDALMTNLSDVALMVQHADCQPVLLYDPVAGAIAAIHSGWRGSVQNIVGKVIERMKNTYASDPANIKAVIGPSLGPCCAEFVHYRNELPEPFWDYKDGKDYFDFWKISAMQLTDAGLGMKNITMPLTCTACSESYFSYRRAVRENGGITGRNGSVIVLHRQ